MGCGGTTCNLSYQGGRDRRLRFEASLGKSMRPCLKNKVKRARGLSEVVGRTKALASSRPELKAKPKFHPEEKKGRIEGR
jgi:hypothetical protein